MWLSHDLFIHTKKVLSKQNMIYLWPLCSLCSFSSGWRLSFSPHVLRRAEIKCEINHLISQLVWPFARKKRQGLFCVKISNSMNSLKNKMAYTFLEKSGCTEKCPRMCGSVRKDSVELLLNTWDFWTVSGDKQISYWEYKLSCLLNVYENVIYWLHKVRLKISKFHCTKQWNLNKLIQNKWSINLVRYIW